MRADWHYFKNGKEQGPVTFEDLQRLAATGELKETDEVWRQGSAADWTAARNVPDLFAKPVPVPSPLPESVLDPVPTASGANSDNIDDRHSGPEVTQSLAASPNNAGASPLPRFKRKNAFLIGGTGFLVLLIGIFVALAMFRSKEDALYKGKPASFWANQLKDRDADTRKEALFALGELGPDAQMAVQAIVKAMKEVPKGNSEEDYLEAAVIALKKIDREGKKAVPALVQVLKEKDASKRKKRPHSNAPLRSKRNRRKQPQNRRPRQKKRNRKRSKNKRRRRKHRRNRRKKKNRRRQRQN